MVSVPPFSRVLVQYIVPFRHRHVSLSSSVWPPSACARGLQHRFRQSMKDRADLHRKDITFAPGQFAWLWLREYRQHSVQRRPSSKLSKRFFGPFRILRRIGAVAYELQLPPGSRIHPVVHVSLLRPYKSSKPPPENPPPLPSQTVSKTLTTPVNSPPLPFQPVSETLTSEENPNSSKSLTSNTQHAPLNTPLVPNTRVMQPLDRSPHLTSSQTKNVPSNTLTDSVSQTATPPLDPCTNPVLQSHPSARSTIRATSLQPTDAGHVDITDLGDKVIFDAEGIVTRPKRVIKKPQKYLD